MNKVLKEKQFSTFKGHTLTYMLIETDDSFKIKVGIDYYIEYDCTGKPVNITDYSESTIFEIAKDITAHVDDRACGAKYIDVASITNAKEIAYDVFDKFK